MASLLTPEFVAAAGLPADAEGQQERGRRLAPAQDRDLHRAGRSGAVPPRPGIARIVAEALAAGWPVAVASTSAEPSVRATLERAVGAEHARAVTVFAGDIVPRKKPAPDIYLLALDSLGLPADRVVVIEDSRNGLLAATGAGADLRDHRQRLHRRRGFQRSRPGRLLAGRSRRRATLVLANRSRATPGAWITLADLASLLPSSNPSPGAAAATLPAQGASCPQISPTSRPSCARSPRSRSTTRSTSATWTPWWATATSATRWRAASSWSCRAGTTSTAPTSAPSSRRSRSSSPAASAARRARSGGRPFCARA